LQCASSYERRRYCLSQHFPLEPNEMTLKGWLSSHVTHVNEPFHTYEYTSGGEPKMRKEPSHFHT